MKTKILSTVLVAALLFIAPFARAQTNSNAIAAAALLNPATANAIGVLAQAATTTGLSAQTLENLISQQYIRIGTPFNVNGQNFLIQTNPDGTYTASTFGTAGSMSFTAPNTTSGVLSTSQQWVANNVAANIDYYSTNGEVDVRCGALYLQSDGTAVADIAIEKYGLLKSAQNLGFGAGVLEGNSGTKSGTAALYAESSYRKPIGDVAIAGELAGGWDNWNRNGFVAAGLRLEYRHSKNLGAYVKVMAAWEPRLTDYPLLAGGGIEYSF